MLGRWIVTRGLDRPKSAHDLADELASASGEPYDSVLPMVTDVVTALRQRGLLEAIDDLTQEVRGHSIRVETSK